MKISQKLIFGYLLIALLVGVAGFVSVIMSEETLKNAIGQSSLIIAHETMENIDGTIYSRIMELKSYSRDLILREAVTRSNDEFRQKNNLQEYISQKDMEWVSAPEGTLTPFMREIMNNDLSEELIKKIEFYEEENGYSVFPEIYVTNRYGVIIASTGRTSDYLQAGEAWYQEAVAVKDFWVGDVEYDESSDAYSSDIVIKLYDDSGTFAGILKGVMNVEEVINIIKVMESGKADKHEEYKGMDFKLLSRDGKIIYATEEFQILSNSDAKLWEVVLKNRKNPSFANFFVMPGDTLGEDDEFIAQHHSNGFMKYKGKGWILLVERELGEIFAPATRLRHYLLIFSLIAAVSAALLGIMISRAISKPIEKLRDAVKKIGEGDLDARIELESNDEIGQLAADFNLMAEKLIEITVSRDDLTKEVVEREEAEEELKKAYDEVSESQLASMNIMEDLERQKGEFKRANDDLSEIQKSSLNMMEDLDREKEKLRKRTHDIGERIKELNCLYKVSNLMIEADRSQDEILDEIVYLMMQAWQYPNISCARITIEGKEYKTDNFIETKWRMSSDILNFWDKVGTVELCYMEERPELYEGPFMKEERELINAIAREVGNYMERNYAEETTQRNSHTQRVLGSILQYSMKTVSLKEMLDFSLDSILSLPFLSTLNKGAILIADEEGKNL